MTAVPAEHEVPPGTPAGLGPVVVGRESSDAEDARTLAATVPCGVLSTLGRNPAGTPFGSLAPFGLDSRARPVLCVSQLAEHTRNLEADPRASLLVSPSVAPGADPLAAMRLTLVGRVERVPGDEAAAARKAHLTGNPHAAGYIDFGDFGLWRLEVESLRFVGGYGRMSWIDLDAWRSATPDPVAPVAEDAVAHLNADHADACLAMARELGRRPDAVEARVTGLDRYGLDLRVTGTRGVGRVRLGFDRPLASSGEVRAATGALVRRAREAPVSP
jgi:heme iron utilization protein